MPTGDLLFAHFPPLLFLPRKEQSWQWSRARFVRSALPPPPLPSTTERGKIKIHRRLVTFPPTARSWESLLKRVLSILEIPDARGCENLTPTDGVGFTKPFANEHGICQIFPVSPAPYYFLFPAASFRRTKPSTLIAGKEILAWKDAPSLGSSSLFITSLSPRIFLLHLWKDVWLRNRAKRQANTHNRSKSYSTMPTCKIKKYVYTSVMEMLSTCLPNNWTRRISLSIRLWGLLISVAVVFSLLIY